MTSYQNCENPQLNSPLNTASSDKFLLMMNLPTILRERSVSDPLLDVNNLQITVHGSVVPAVSVPSIDVPYKGQNVTVSSYARPRYEPLVVNFLIDNQYKNYYIFWKWLALLNEASKSFYSGSVPPIGVSDKALQGNIAEYQTTLTITALDEYTAPVMQFTYLDAFITNLGNLNYSYIDGKILDTNVQFSFSRLLISPLKK
jgi:hypothetical protein